MVSQVLDDYSQFNSEEEVGARDGMEPHSRGEHVESVVLDVGDEEDRTKCYREKGSSSHEDLSLINNFINRGLLVPRASDNVFVIHRDVTAKHR